MIAPRTGAQVLGILIVRRQHPTDESQIRDRGHGLFLVEPPVPILILLPYTTTLTCHFALRRCPLPPTTMHLPQAVCFLGCALAAYAKTVSYEFNVGYVTVSAKVLCYPVWRSCIVPLTCMVEQFS